MPNTTTLWCESVTSHGIADRNEATVVPNPTSTSNDGSAQQSNVLTDVNKEK
jgi:hypothetical protein